MEEFAGKAIGMVIGVMILGALAVTVGMFVLPVLVPVVGGLYYYRNVYKPKQATKADLEKTDHLLAEAGNIAPRTDEFLDRLAAVGIVAGTPERTAAEGLYIAEGLAPPEPPHHADAIERARYRDAVKKFINSNQGDRYARFERVVIDALTPATNKDGGIFAGRRRRSPQQIEDLILSFFGHEDLFADLQKTLDRNLNEQNEVVPSKYKGDNCAWDYLKDTPLLELEYVESRVGLKDRMAHTMILGGSGAGKTNLIEYIVGQDLSAEEPSTVVVLDSQVQMIPKLAKLDLPIEEVAYLSPQWDMALNIFDVGYERLKASGDAEFAINKAVALIRFVLEGALSTAMTDRQRTMFDYAIQLIISIPGGNLLTFLELLEEDGINKYADRLGEFDATTQDFFRKDWNSDDYRRTRQAIRSRLFTLLKNPTFRRLFSATENTFNVFDELQSRRLILLDTNKPLLDNEGAAFLGRLYIAMMVQAAHRRFDSKGKGFRPVYMVIDEAQEYFDERIAEMLEQARKANIGLTLAHQTVSQIRKRSIDPATVIGNTATKIVGTQYPDDAREMGKAMRVSTDTILDLPQYSFGMYHRSTGFVSIRAPKHPLAQFEYRHDAKAVQDAMEARYGGIKPEDAIEPAAGDTAGSTAPAFDLDDVKPI